MAGDWIAMRFDLATDPSVIQMAAELGLDEDTVVGKLHRFWCWCSEVTLDGHVAGVTIAWLNRYIDVTHFGEALERAGWLVVSDGQIRIPNWDYWMSESAKKRLVDRRRQRTYRNKQRHGNVTKVSRSKRDSSVTTVQERTVQKNKKNPPVVPLPPELETDGFRKAWQEWQQHRREKGQTLKPTTISRQLKKLAGWGERRAIAAIERSIEQGYTGIFEPNDSGTKTQPAEKFDEENLRRWYDDLPSTQRRQLTEQATGSEHGCYDVGAVPLHEKMRQVRALWEREGVKGL